ncbi:MAG: UDP-N-acetylglucosamine 2-epimerase (non-hydrolyzing) [candidate division Zixibacteria bacterium]|nr:UDP-N-acetylglucosamine 2-epimerase (non-hydrolyzing) [candidate division Zixibacteria bacterium]
MNSNPRIVSVVGARPQFVKLAPLVQPLSKRFEHLIVHTGQHFDDNMSAHFFRQLNLPEIYRNLGVQGGSHATMIGRMLIRLEKVFRKSQPDLVLVYGDANSTLAGALTAVKQSTPVIHIEAGMRADGTNLPEEINRRLTDNLSELLFCVTDKALQNLHSERLEGRAILSGDLMLELLNNMRTAIRDNTGFLKLYGLTQKQYLLLTVHRPSTTDEHNSLKKLVSIVNNLQQPILFPLHPRTRKMLRRFRLLKRLENIPHLVITEPLDYLDNLTATRNAFAVLTDSGGLQKEALALGTPVLTLRRETEWVDTLERGNTLVGLDWKRISSGLSQLPKVPRFGYRINGKRPSQIIVREIVRFLRSS